MYSGAGPELRPRRPRRHRTFLGAPWWWAGVDADRNRHWWLFAVILCPLVGWTLALVLIPYGESIDEMRPYGSGLALIAAPLVTWIAATRRTDRTTLVRATTLSLGAIACALIVAGALALCAFFIYVAVAWPGG